jgi:hypothetical protein
VSECGIGENPVATGGKSEKVFVAVSRCMMKIDEGGRRGDSGRG